MGALACISLGRDKWGACAEGRWFDDGDEEMNDILIIVVVVKKKKIFDGVIGVEKRSVVSLKINVRAGKKEQMAMKNVGR